MKNLTLTIAIAATALFVSCNSSDHGDSDPSLPKFSTVNEPQPSMSQDSLAPVLNNASGNVALNPPHGEPGHICEIPVGDPLPGASGNASPAPAVSPVLPSASPLQTRLNPPHGQPGHVCEIPVGQPLP